MEAKQEIEMTPKNIGAEYIASTQAPTGKR